MQTLIKLFLDSRLDWVYTVYRDLIRFPVLFMFQEHCWLTVGSTCRIKYNKAVLKQYMTPERITKLLTPMSQSHSLNLRPGGKGTLSVLLPRTTLYSDAFSCSAPRLWNSLPHAIRNAGSLNLLKKSKIPVLGIIRKWQHFLCSFITLHLFDDVGFGRQSCRLWTPFSHSQTVPREMAGGV